MSERDPEMVDLNGGLFEALTHGEQRVRYADIPEHARRELEAAQAAMADGTALASYRVSFDALDPETRARVKADLAAVDAMAQRLRRIRERAAAEAMRRLPKHRVRLHAFSVN